jgi:hypothetical protein
VVIESNCPPHLQCLVSTRNALLFPLAPEPLWSKINNVTGAFRFMETSIARSASSAKAWLCSMGAKSMVHVVDDPPAHLNVSAF